MSCARGGRSARGSSRKKEREAVACRGGAALGSSGGGGGGSSSSSSSSSSGSHWASAFNNLLLTTFPTGLPFSAADAAHRPGGQVPAGVCAKARPDPSPRPAAPRSAAGGPLPQVLWASVCGGEGGWQGTAGSWAGNSWLAQDTAGQPLRGHVLQPGHVPIPPIRQPVTMPYILATCPCLYPAPASCPTGCSPTKVSPSVTIKEDCVLLNCGGVRAVVTEDKCLLFEPTSPASRKFLEIVVPKIQSAGGRAGGRAGGWAGGCWKW